MRLVGSFDSTVLAAVADDVRALTGGTVARVSQPGEHEIGLEIRGRVILCSIHPQWARVHLAPDAAGGPLSPFAQMLRSRLARARLSTVGQPLFERTLTLGFETDEGSSDLTVEIMGRHSNLLLVQEGLIAGALKLVPPAKSSVREVRPGRPYAPPPRSRPTPLELTREHLSELLASADGSSARLLSSRLVGLSPTMAVEVAVRAGVDPQARIEAPDQVDRIWETLQWLCEVVRTHAFHPVIFVRDGEVRGYAAFPLHSVRGLEAEPVATMSEAVARVTAAVGAQAELEERRAALAGAIRTALARVAKTEEDLRRGLAEAGESEAAKQRGELLLAYASQIPRGAGAATVPGYDGEPITIQLDPTLTPVENARRIFARYAKMRRAVPALQARLEQTAQERLYLESALAMAEQAVSLDDLRDLRHELVEEGYLRARGATRPAPPARPRTITLDSGASVLVGRTNLDNDRITFKAASPEDLWFHARGAPGAHVILRTAGGRPSPADIERAASLAAWFSRARGSQAVAVDYTERRHVRKPRGSRPGFVVYERERTIHVSPGAP